MQKITVEDSYTLVGKFTHFWALMENVLDVAIAEALDLSLSSYFLFGRVLSISQKRTILEKLVSLSQISIDEKKQFTSLMKKLGKSKSDRNTVAHCVFSLGSDGKSVSFVRISFSGGAEYPTPHWTRSDFSKKIERLVYVREQLAILRRNLERQKPLQKLNQLSTDKLDKTVYDFIADMAK